MWVCPAVRYYPHLSHSPPVSQCVPSPPSLSNRTIPQLSTFSRKAVVQYSIVGHVSCLRFRFEGSSKRRDSRLLQALLWSAPWDLVWIQA